ncbi:hypothetical protein HYW67_03685 [Candidatus Parcubacteria bacterium]|nr:hypothetical protein [Candidatus Parcubacteria bacterium]
MNGERQTALAQKLAELETELAGIRKLKSEALEAGGNGWHDNASYDIVVQDEYRLLRKIAELKAKVQATRG